PGGADTGLVDAWLRDQIRQRGIYIAWPRLRDNPLALLRRHRVESFASAFPVPSIVERQRWEAARTELGAERFPRRARGIAHVEQNYTRTGSVGWIVRGLQHRAI